MIDGMDKPKIKDASEHLYNINMKQDLFSTFFFSNFLFINLVEEEYSAVLLDHLDAFVSSFCFSNKNYVLMDSNY